MSTTVDHMELTERVVRFIAEAFGEPAHEQPSAERLAYHAGLAFTLLDNVFGGDQAKFREFIERAQAAPRTILSLGPAN
jgi:hypothetical protein